MDIRVNQFRPKRGTRQICMDILEGDKRQNGSQALLGVSGISACSDGLDDGTQERSGVDKLAHKQRGERRTRGSIRELNMTTVRTTRCVFKLLEDFLGKHGKFSDARDTAAPPPSFCTELARGAHALA